MPITIAGSGTITGISAGGLPDASIVTADIADANITAAKLDGAQSGSAPVYGCRAWVNFDGTKDTTGATSTANTNRLIRASGNVASVLRNAAGDYTITFTTAMPDANYSVTAALTHNTSAGSIVSLTTFATGTLRVGTLGYGVGNFDPTNVCISVFR